jgi:hypothetical protein
MMYLFLNHPSQDTTLPGLAELPEDPEQQLFHHRLRTYR